MGSRPHLVRIEDSCLFVCFSLGPSYFSALSIRSIDAPRLEDIPALVFTLGGDNGWLFTDI